MNWAILKNNKVTNIIVADKDFVTANYPNAVLVTDSCGIGWTYNGTQFIDTVSIVVPQKPDETPAP